MRLVRSINLAQSKAPVFFSAVLLIEESVEAFADIIAGLRRAGAARVVRRCVQSGEFIKSGCVHPGSGRPASAPRPLPGLRLSGGEAFALSFGGLLFSGVSFASIRLLLSLRDLLPLPSFSWRQVVVLGKREGRRRRREEGERRGGEGCQGPVTLPRTRSPALPRTENL